MDVRHEIDQARRSVGTRTLEAGTASVVTIARTYPTDVDDLWAACTEPDRLKRWFLPVSGELGVGGRYQLEGNAGGTITACKPPRAFDATWEFGGQVSWIEVRVGPDDDGARLEIAHIAHIDDDFWPRYGPGAVGLGWDLGLCGLALHLSTGEAL